MIENSLRLIRPVLILLFFLITASSFAQDVTHNKKEQVSFQESHESHPLSDVLKKFETDFGISFMFDPEIIKNKRVEKITMKGTVDQQLTAILTPLNLSFKRIHKNYYVIQSLANE